MFLRGSLHLSWKWKFGYVSVVLSRSCLVFLVFLAPSAFPDLRIDLVRHTLNSTTSCFFYGQSLLTLSLLSEKDLNPHADSESSQHHATFESIWESLLHYLPPLLSFSFLCNSLCTDSRGTRLREMNAEGRIKKIQDGCWDSRVCPSLAVSEQMFYSKCTNRRRTQSTGAYLPINARQLSPLFFKTHYTLQASARGSLSVRDRASSRLFAADVHFSPNMLSPSFIAEKELHLATAASNGSDKVQQRKRQVVWLLKASHLKNH